MKGVVDLLVESPIVFSLEFDACRGIPVYWDRRNQLLCRTVNVSASVAKKLGRA